MNPINRIKAILGNLSTSSIHPEILQFAILGYTDLMLSKDEWLQHIDEAAYTKLDSRVNAEKLKNIHARPDVEKVPNWKSVEEIVFNNLVKFSMIDFQQYEGSELIIDLNYRIPEIYIEKYNAVLDLGTSEHIFNYPQVLMNCHLLTKVGGVIYHEVPLNWPNHGFYNISPTLFYDFYSDNESTTLECTGMSSARGNGKFGFLSIQGVPLWERFNLDQIEGKEVEICYLVRKNKSVFDFTYPIQRKYRDAVIWQ